MTRPKGRSSQPTKNADPASPPRSKLRPLLKVVLAGLALAVVIGFWQQGHNPAPADAPGASTQSTSSKTADSSAEPAKASFVGSQACAGCHADEHVRWTGSQHQRAMQPANADTVLGNFSDGAFEYAGVRSTFSQRGGDYYVRTDGADGELAEFRIAYTFGVEPLQQYLIEFPDGRLQALSIAWDSRSSEAGGQRWFHLYPNERIDFRDELHWTGPAHNWNFMCADCHSIDVRKNYDAKQNRFDSTWAEISVGCEACHGPASKHLQWAEDGSKASDIGLSTALTQQPRHWTIDPQTGNAKPKAVVDNAEIEICAQCHSRRGQIAEGYHAGVPFQDHYRPVLLTPGPYFADGQQREEVYTWASFLQSKMHQVGVSCADCHEPHTQELRTPGNALCASCHLAGKYDAATHHHHPADAGPGTRCVDCHMPTTTYMVVDPRHDHSLRIPRPDMSEALGTPNACNQCHQSQSAQWAAQQVSDCFGKPAPGNQRFAGALTLAQLGAAAAGDALLDVVQDPSLPAIARASAIEAMTAYPTAQSIAAAAVGLSDADPLIRRASLAVISQLPPSQRWKLAGALLNDPVRSVRIEAADSLVDALAEADPAQRRAFARAAAEFESAQQLNSDRPEARTALASFQLRQGRLAQAEALLRSSLALDPRYLPAYLNLADLQRTQGLDMQAEQTLRDGLQQSADSADLQHALGLTLIRLQRADEGLQALAQASRLAPGNGRFAYVYAIALNSLGQTPAALEEIDRALTQLPDDRSLLTAAMTIRHEQGDRSGALHYAQRLQQRYPQDPAAARLLKESE